MWSCIFQFFFVSGFFYLFFFLKLRLSSSVFYSRPLSSRSFWLLFLPHNAFSVFTSFFLLFPFLSSSSFITPRPMPRLDSWKIAVLGDGGVGKTALSVQVRSCSFPFCILPSFYFRYSDNRLISCVFFSVLVVVCSRLLCPFVNSAVILFLGVFLTSFLRSLIEVACCSFLFSHVHFLN